MAKQVLEINPEVRVLHHNNVFFAGKLSGTISPIQLSELDIIILSYFLKASAPQTVAKKLQTRKLAKLIPIVPTLENIYNRIQQLHNSKILVRVHSTKKKILSGTLSLVDCTEFRALDNNLHLRLSRNFSLEPVQSGFKIWSSVSRKHHILDIELVLLLISFSHGKSICEVNTEKSIISDNANRTKGINWLFNNGLLVKCVSETAILNRPSVESREHIPPTQAHKKAESWNEMEPDGRIPIYFAPHMPNHYPLALGMIYSAIKSHKDGELLKKYQLLPISYMTPKELLNGPYKKFGKGVWLFSNYMWSIEINLNVSNRLKDSDKGNLTIHGGPSTPSYKQACADFMNINKSVDVAVHGEGEVAAAEILEVLFKLENGDINYIHEELKMIDGITFRHMENLVHTGDRIRFEQPDMIPSPYTDGVFDSYNANVDAAIIESNRGCPFGCTFCDWGSATRQKVRKFDLDRVKKEIEWIGENKVRVLWIADANYGMYNRDVDLSKWIVETKEKYGFPVEVVVNYTKNTTSRLAEIIKIFTSGGIISQGIISIQTTDEVTLDVVNRKNIKIEKYDELTRIFADSDLPLSTDLMIGLPGITVEAFDRDLQYYIDVDVAVKAYPTQLLPNSPMADPEYISKYEIKTDENDYLISCYSYTPAELDSMKSIYKMYVVAEGYSVIRYVLRYLQWEHNIQALTFLHKLEDEIRKYPDHYPSITWAIKYFSADKCMPGGWKRFYDEIALFAKNIYKIKRDPVFDTVLLVNEVVMPDDTIRYPLTVDLEYDFASYFIENNDKSISEKTPLNDYPAGSLTIDDPDLMSLIDDVFSQYDSHQFFWELRSRIARANSVSDLRDMRCAINSD